MGLQKALPFFRLFLTWLAAATQISILYLFGCATSKSLSNEHIEKAIEVILNDSNSYVEHARNDLIYGLAEHLFYNHISQSTATMLVGRLCNTVSRTISKRIWDVSVR